MLGRMLRPGGVMVVSTMNRTWRSMAMAKIGAEYVLRLLPVGTHDWRKFITLPNWGSMRPGPACALPMWREWCPALAAGGKAVTWR